MNYNNHNDQRKLFPIGCSDHNAQKIVAANVPSSAVSDTYNDSDPLAIAMSLPPSPLTQPGIIKGWG